MLQELRKPSKAILEMFVDSDKNRLRDEFVHVPEDEILATWWVQLTSGTTYWRGIVPARHLPGQALRFTFKDLKVDDEGLVVTPRQRGAAIWQFVGVARRALIMAHQMNYHGVRVLMDVDDNYLQGPPIPGIGQWKSKLNRQDDTEYSHQAHRKIVRWVDGVIVSTEDLAERYAQVTQAPIYHCPNSIDLDDWPGHADGFTAAYKGADEPLAIGYAGSTSHMYDVLLVDRGLDWAYRQPNVKLWSLGQLKWRFPSEQIPWTEDLAQYRRNLRTLDVGLCPLKRSDWHDGKSDIKAMEYLLSGAVPIVQRDSPCYKDWIDVVPSATTEKDWLKQIKWAIGAPREELREVWQRGYDFLLQNKLIETHIAKWKAAVES